MNLTSDDKTNNNQPDGQPADLPVLAPKNNLLKPIVFIIIILVILSACFGLIAYNLNSKVKTLSADYDKLGKEKLEFRNNYVKLEGDYSKLDKDYKELSSDRENLLAQVKVLVPEKNRAKELETQLTDIKNKLDLLDREKEEVLNQTLQYKQEVAQLQDEQKRILEEKSKLEADLAREKDKSLLKKAESDNASLRKENANLSSDLKKAQGEAGKLKEREAKIKELQDKLEDIDRSYDEAVKKNSALEQKITKSPQRFAEIARQNQALIKETSNIHYNLGVFYNNKKEYSRAIAEFEKALELNPGDAYAQFNLGYIYAEQMVNRPKAIQHFKQYLRLANQDDKDVDWVKKYLLTWETYDQKRPMD